MSNDANASFTQSLTQCAINAHLRYLIIFMLLERERDGEKRMKEKLFANHNTTGHFFVVGCTDGERERSCVTVCSRDREHSY